MTRVARHLMTAAALVLVAALWLNSSVTLDGQGSTVIAAPAVRQGDYISPDATLPASGIQLVTVSFDIPNTSEYENAANTIAFAVEMSPDGVSGWRQTAGFGWRGSHYVDPKTGAVNPAPTVTFDLRPWTAQGLTHVRAHVTVPNAITAGVTVTLQ